MRASRRYSFVLVALVVLLGAANSCDSPGGSEGDVTAAARTPETGTVLMFDGPGGQGEVRLVRAGHEICIRTLGPEGAHVPGLSSCITEQRPRAADDPTLRIGRGPSPVDPSEDIIWGLTVGSSVALATDAREHVVTPLGADIRGWAVVVPADAPVRRFGTEVGGRMIDDPATAELLSDFREEIEGDVPEFGGERLE